MEDYGGDILRLLHEVMDVHVELVRRGVVRVLDVTTDPIVVANVDPHSARETTVHLDTTVFGIEPGASYDVEDLVTGQVWTWADHNFVRLDAFAEPVHILHVKENR